MIKLYYRDGGVAKALDLMIDGLNDLGPIFRRFAKWMRGEIDKVFEAQGTGWPRLSQATLEGRKTHREIKVARIRQGAWRTLESKLSSEETRVLRRLEKRQALRDFSEKGRKLLARAQKAAERQAVIKSEFKRLEEGHAGPVRKEAAKLIRGGAGDLGRIGRRMARAEEKVRRYESGEALGAIANSFGIKIDKGSLEIFSHITWAGVHNEGGTAGHGAAIPQRKFLEWTPQRIAKLCEISQQYMLEKFAKGQPSM